MEYCFFLAVAIQKICLDFEEPLILLLVKRKGEGISAYPFAHFSQSYQKSVAKNVVLGKSLYSVSQWEVCISVVFLEPAHS